MISCFQPSNGIMQNTITRERTLQYVEAGQVPVLKGESVESDKPPQTASSSLLSASECTQHQNIVGGIMVKKKKKKKEFLANGYCFVF